MAHELLNRKANTLLKKILEGIKVKAQIISTKQPLDFGLNSENSVDHIRKNFDQVYVCHLGSVKKTIQRFRFSAPQAEDLVQQIFLTAWTKLHTLKDPKALPGWIKTIARNQCLTEIKKERPMISISTTDHIDEANDSWQMILEADDDKEYLEWKYNMELLAEMIEVHQHPIRGKLAKLFYLDHLSVQDICQIMDMKQNTVLSHLRRFRIQITEAMITLLESQEDMFH